jgi:hypothetical protein
MTIIRVVGRHGECCWVSRCRESGCAVRLPARGSKLCMSGSEYQQRHSPAQKLCDCLVFWEDGASEIACSIELKAGTPDVAEAAEQLQAGARIVEELVAECEGVEFFPILASGNMTMPEMKVLERRKVRFRGRDFPIIRLKCGNASVEDAVARNR